MGKHHKKHKKKTALKSRQSFSVEEVAFIIACLELKTYIMPSAADTANDHSVVKKEVEINEFLDNLSLTIQEHLREGGRDDGG